MRNVQKHIYYLRFSVRIHVSVKLILIVQRDNLTAILLVIARRRCVAECANNYDANKISFVAVT